MDFVLWIIFDVLLPFLFYRLFKNPARPKLSLGTNILYTLLVLIALISLLISLLGLGVALPGLQMFQTLTPNDWITEIYLLILPILNSVMLFIIPRQISSQAIRAFIGMVTSANLPAWIGFGSIVLYSPLNTESITMLTIFGICLAGFILSLWLWVWWEKLSISKPPTTPPKRRYNVNKEPDFLRTEK